VQYTIIKQEYQDVTWTINTSTNKEIVTTGKRPSCQQNFYKYPMNKHKEKRK